MSFKCFFLDSAKQANGPLMIYETKNLAITRI